MGAETKEQKLSDFAKSASEIALAVSMTEGVDRSVEGMPMSDALLQLITPGSYENIGREYIDAIAALITAMADIKSYKVSLPHFTVIKEKLEGLTTTEIAKKYEYELYKVTRTLRYVIRKSRAHPLAADLSVLIDRIISGESIVSVVKDVVDKLETTSRRSAPEKKEVRAKIPEQKPLIRQPQKPIRERLATRAVEVASKNPAPNPKTQPVFIPKDDEDIRESIDQIYTHIQDERAVLNAEPLQEGLHRYVDEDDDDISQQLAAVRISSDSVRDYLNLAAKRPLLRAEQEVELAQAIEVGVLAAERLELQAPTLTPLEKRELEELKRRGERAKALFLESNLRLVASIARRYGGKGLQYLDLIQEGNTGLIRAMEKFDYTKGFKFSTYATWWVRQAISRAIADQAKTIRIPVHMGEVVNKVHRVRQKLIQDLGRDPSPEELSMEVGITPAKLKEVQSYGHEPISINTRLGEGGDTEFGDLIADTAIPDPSQGLMVEEIQKALTSFLDRLSEREAGIIRMRFGLQGSGERMTLDQIGEAYGITRERVRQLESKTLAKMRHPSSGLHQLLAYLED